MPPAEAAGLKIPCPTPQLLQAELDALATVLEPPEREDTWEKFEKSIIRFAGVTRGGGYKHLDVFVRGVGNKGVGLRIVDCMMSDRGRLSGVSTDLLQTMAPRLASHFAPLVLVYLPPLVRLLARPNKVYFKRAERCLATIIQHCHLPIILTHLRIGLDDRSDQCKRASGIGIETTLVHWDGPRWHEKDLDVLEDCVRKMATDRDSEVRKTGKRVWAQFCELWPERVEDFTDPLTPTIRRYLDIPAGDRPSQPKVRPAVRPRAQAAHPQPEASTRAQAHAPAHGTAGAQTRSSSRNAPSEQRQRVPSGPSATESGAPQLTRSNSQTVLSHASLTSSFGRSDSTRHRVLSKPSRPHHAREQHDREGESSSSRRMPPPSRTVSHGSDAPDDEPRQTRSAFVTRPALRPLRQAVSADSFAYATSSASVTPTEQPTSSSKSIVKERVSELEKKAGQGTPTAYRLSPSKPDLARAAAVPLPDDSPVATKRPLPPSKPHLPESPSLAMLLNHHPNDAPEMPTLLDLSMADMTITALSDTPGPVPKRQLSQTLREPAPSPGSVAQLIGRFSKSPSATPSKATPTRAGASSSPSFAEHHTTPTANPALSRTPSRLSADPTGPHDASPSTTPGQGKQRRISPLPRRASHLPTPENGNEDEDEESANRSLKRKGSDIELSFTESTPVPRSKVAPRFSQPLIAFGDTPRRQTMRPFVFGAGHAGFFDDLMGIQTGDLDEDVAHEGLTQLLDGLVLGTPAAEPAQAPGPASASVEADLLDSPAPAILATALEPESGTDLVDLNSAPAPAVANTQQREGGATVEEPSPEPAEEVPSTTTTDEPLIDVDSLEATLAVTTINDDAQPSSSDVVHIQETLLEPTEAAASEPTGDSAVEVATATVIHETAPEEETTPDTPWESSGPTAASGSAPSTAPAVVLVEQPQAKVLPQQGQKEPTVNSPIEQSHAPLPAECGQTKPPIATESEQSRPSVLAPREPSKVPPAQTELPLVAAPPPTRRHMRNMTAPVKPTAAAVRLGPPSKPHRPAPAADKKSFKPVSRLGVADSSKSAPAPARLAMATKASQAKAAAPAPPKAAVHKAPSAGAASRPPSRQPSRPASRQVSRTASPHPDQDSELGNPSKETKPARSVSNVLKPTAAAAARAAANAATVKEPKEAPKPTRPTTLASRPPPPRVVSNPRPAGSLFAPTAASRARAEAALPPVKRQRVKLKAPMESFKPGRSRVNPSKAAIVGSAPARGRARPVKKGGVETFALPGPLLGTSEAEPESSMQTEQEIAGVSAIAPAPSLSIPAQATNDGDAEVGMARTPTALSPLAYSAALSPASSRHTERSFDSSRSGSSPRTMRPSPSRPLDPVLTPMHSTLSAPSTSMSGSDETPTRQDGETPATAHARRISGIPASVKRAMSRAEPLSPPNEASEDDFGERAEKEQHGDGVTSVVRHDVSTPQGKASSLLAQFQGRSALTPRDGNRDKRE